MRFSWLKRPLYMADDGGSGSGAESETSFVELAAGTEPDEKQVGSATEWLKTNTENFDPKSIEGKKPSEIYALARTSWTAKQNANDPFKGTPYEGQKVPDKFIVEKDGKKTVDPKAILNSYTELEKQQMRRREEVVTEARNQLEAERKKAAPTAPGDYRAGEPMKFDGGQREALGIKIGEREIEILQDDPALSFLKGVAHKYGMPQAEFNEVVKGYITAAFSSGPKWADEAKALGGDAIADKRQARVDGFLKANLSSENYNYFARLPATAQSITAVEQLMTLSGHPAFIPDKGDIPNETYTRDELKKMQADPRYTGEGGKKDKAFVAQVKAGFTRLAKQGAK